MPRKKLSPIEKLVDSAQMRCTVCRGPAGVCDCWTKCECGMSFLKGKSCRNPIHDPANCIKMVCPGCKADKQIKRSIADPPTAATIEVRCPNCWPAAMVSCETVYRDASGKEVFVSMLQ